ncbi:TPA: hypothetical protein N0F65_012291 [Lagenidium giganteum]|uniref:Uncharacterized protein n=1 Tax=Lagenidium giganteum TaxID=4803 RepID=A0AAV2ZBB5_9STRA|nr:TPA: hypothetical protein N0F65_012291 [Lagenidium giganteum]
MWKRKREKLAFAVDPPAKRGTARANKLTLEGSGRVSKADAIEDALVQYIKNLRRDEVVVCRDTIVHRLMPDFLRDKSGDAALTWCSRLMRRRRLTVLCVTRSGRKVNEELEEENRVVVFAQLATESLQTYCVDVPTGLLSLIERCLTWSKRQNNLPEHGKQGDDRLHRQPASSCDYGWQ